MRCDKHFHRKLYRILLTVDRRRVTVVVASPPHGDTKQRPKRSSMVNERYPAAMPATSSTAAHYRQSRPMIKNSMTPIG